MTQHHEQLATAVLYREHRLIERVLGVLHVLARRVRSGEEFPLDDARDAVTFLREFADACHHGKEEARLFPAMESHGLPQDVGPTAVMRHEHDQGRAHVRAMAQAVEGDSADLPVFANHATAFALLLTDHIAKEDQVLFPMAEQMLAPDRMAELKQEFERFDAEDVGPERHAALVAIGERLATTYGVAATATGETEGGPSCLGC